MKNILIFILVVFLAWKLFFGPGEVTLGPGVRAPEIALQQDIFYNGQKKNGIVKLMALNQTI